MQQDRSWFPILSIAGLNTVDVGFNHIHRQPRGVCQQVIDVKGLFKFFSQYAFKDHINKEFFGSGLVLIHHLRGYIFEDLA